MPEPIPKLYNVDADRVRAIPPVGSELKNNFAD